MKSVAMRIQKVNTTNATAKWDRETNTDVLEDKTMAKTIGNILNFE